MNWRIVGLAVLAALPAFAQDTAFREPEVYAIAGYSHVNDTTGLCMLCLSGAAQSNHAPGGFFGAGVGARIASLWGKQDTSLWCMQGEFLRARSKFLQEPYLNTGALNFVLEKRSGKVRPAGLVLGIGGAQGSGGGHLFLQAGGGVAVMLNERWLVRPQVRLQWWTQALNTSRVTISVGVAIGYRF